MKKGFLDYYNKWLETGKLPKDGLCQSLPDHLTDTEVWGSVLPTSEDYDNLCNENTPQTYWGSEDWDDRYRKFTPRRQTILLFAAILNNEEI